MKKNISFISFAGLWKQGFSEKKKKKKKNRADVENDFGRKIGQLNQYNDDITATGPVTKDADKAGQVRAGKLVLF